jgi:hypothetical protein
VTPCSGATRSNDGFRPKAVALYTPKGDHSYIGHGLPLAPRTATLDVRLIGDPHKRRRMIVWAVRFLVEVCGRQGARVNFAVPNWGLGWPPRPCRRRCAMTASGRQPLLEVDRVINRSSWFANDCRSA